MLRFRHGITVLLVCLLSQTGLVLPVEAGALVKGTVAFRGIVPVAETMQVTADNELCGKEALIQAVQVNKHTFMTGALQVFDHPYFAVTDEFGVFQLPPLPAGSYTVVVWHETLGSLEQEITVPTQGTITIDFDYPL